MAVPGFFSETCREASDGVVLALVLLVLVAWNQQGSLGPAAAQQQDKFLRDASISSPVAARLAAQNALFKKQYEDDLKVSPQTATARGDYRYNTMLDDYSLKASERQNAADRSYRAKLAAISTEGFAEQDQLSHDLLLHVLDDRIADFELKNYEMPLSQIDGIHLSLADLPNAVPLDSVKHYQDYITRLRQIPRAFDQTIAVLRQGEKDGLMPVRSLLEQISAECQGTVAEDPFLAPTKMFPAVISEPDRKRLTENIVQAVNSEVLPAYRRFAEFVAKDYAPHGRTTIGLSSLPGGARRYRQAIRELTTTDMSPEEIHALGLREVERITGLLTSLANQAGYKDLNSFRVAVNRDPKYIPKSPDEILQDFRRYIDQMQPHLPELFGVFPKTPLKVEAVPASQPNNSSHYVPGTPDGTRPGRVVVATSNYAQHKRFGDETVAYHEGIPGHHMQVSIQQQLTGLPEFRLYLLNSAYAEGWGLYAEALGKEIGFFQDAGSDYGRLSLELLRAVRLVVDTGIHSQGWTRDQALAYVQANGVSDEIDRYLAWPAQALSYKIGQLKILELRNRAKQQLGPRFDLKAFHDEILSGGNLPLDMLEARVDSWIASQSALKIKRK